LQEAGFLSFNWCVRLAFRSASSRNVLEFTAAAEREGARVRGGSFRPPTLNLHRLMGDPDQFIYCLVEASLLGANPLKLVAVAALRATRAHPESFGAIDSWDTHHAQHEEKQARLEYLYRRIADNWAQAPYRVEDVRPDGYAKIVLTVGDREVRWATRRRWVNGCARRWFDRGRLVLVQPRAARPPLMIATQQVI
jgi:hypothetical protein